MIWRRVKAKLLARAGEDASAEQLARDAVAISLDTDYLDGQATSQADLAEVLMALGKATEAVAALREAEALFERKGNVVSARRARDRLAELA